MGGLEHSTRGGVGLHAAAGRLLPGSEIGRYVILDYVGHGGMGVVYSAYDPKLDRRVALKLLHEADDDHPVRRARLVREARSLAKISHRNVVAVHDVDIHAGRVVLAMEFIEGQSLRQWLSRTRDWREIVAMFVEAGRGLEAVHQAEVVHRDFKPENVMITTEGRVVVMDFGLARLNGSAADDEGRRSSPFKSTIEASLECAELDRLTAHGRILGTPGYMAPEQYVGRPDQGSDQFSFCVALFEALTGVLPFGERPGLDAFFVVHADDVRSRAAAHRVPYRIRAAIARGLQRDPNDRWPRMSALLGELEKRPARRRWPAFAAAGIVIGSGGLTHALGSSDTEVCTGGHARLQEIWNETRKAEVETAMRAIGKAYALDAWIRTEYTLDLYAKQWVAMHHDACAATSVRAEQSIAVMDLRMACLDRAREAFEATAHLLTSADATVVQNAHDLAASLPPISRCADIDGLDDFESPPPDERDAVEHVQGLLAQARAERVGGRHAESKRALDAAAERALEISYGPVLVDLALARGLTDADLGAYDDAERSLREAVRLAAKHQRWSQFATATIELMYVVGYHRSRVAEALILRDQAAGFVDGELTSEVEMLEELGGVLAHAGRFAEAESHFRRAIELESRKSPRSVDVARSRQNLAIALRAQGKLEPAEAENRAALELLEEILGPTHPLVAQSRTALSVLLRRRGNFAEAQREAREALALAEHSLGPDHPASGHARSALLTALVELGRLEEAEMHARTLLASSERTLGADHPDVAGYRTNLAEVLRRAGRLDEAEAELRTALTSWTATLGADHPYVTEARRQLDVVAGQAGSGTK